MIKGFGHVKHGNFVAVKDEWASLLKSYELAKLIKISQGSLSDIENEKSLPSADTIAKLYQFTNLNIVWLLTGKGPMTRDESPSAREGNMVSEVMEQYGEDQKLRELVERVVRIYKKGGVEKRAHLMGFVNGADPGE